MSNYTPEEERALRDAWVAATEKGAIYYRGAQTVWDAAIAFAATLRQQAGRVNEDAVERAYDAFLRLIGTEAHMALSKLPRHTTHAAMRAALAQNTQGEGGSSFHEGIKFAFNVMKSYAHAERARVPDGWVPRAVAEVAQGDLHMLKKAIEARDPWPELLVRVTDTERDLRTALAASPSQRAEVK